MNLSTSQLYLRLLSYVKPYWRVFAASIVGTAIAAATEPLLPALLKPMLDGTFVQKDDFVIMFVVVYGPEDFCGILTVSGKDFLVHPGDPFGSALQAFPLRILSDGCKDFPDGPDYLFFIDLFRPERMPLLLSQLSPPLFSFPVFFRLLFLPLLRIPAPLSPSACRRVSPVYPCYSSV